MSLQVDVTPGFMISWVSVFVGEHECMCVCRSRISNDLKGFYIYSFKFNILELPKHTV